MDSGACLPAEQAPTLAESPTSALFAVLDPPQPFTLPCSTNAPSQKVTYTWQKDGKPFDWSGHGNVVKREGEGSLVFLTPKASDVGHYQCFAISDYGVASTGLIEVKKAYINIPKVTVQRHKPIEGQPFKLECPIPDSYPQPKIEWRLQFESDPSVSNEVANSRYTVAPDGTLYFSSIDKSDTFDNFKYVCQASSPATTKPVVLAEHYLEGVEPNKGHDYSEVVEQYASPNLTVKVGEVTVLYCIFGGIPLGHPDWFHDGQDVNNSPKDRVTRYNKSKGKRLLIRETWLTDQGIYTCNVDNEMGKPKHHSMFLTVVSAPVFDKKPPTQLSVKEGEEVKIPCSVLAVPSASASWSHNGTPISKNEGLVIEQSSNANRTVSDIKITSAKKSDSGYYGCTVINPHGYAYAETLVTVA
ncbi:hemolin-like [Battus philenor]|uniref:hemolin-like n=1 Tax=Battus philenor TaxID=42288 RepID=UPI0035CEE92D